MHISRLFLTVMGALIASTTAQQTPGQLAAQVPTCAVSRPSLHNLASCHSLNFYQQIYIHIADQY